VAASIGAGERGGYSCGAGAGFDAGFGCWVGVAQRSKHQPHEKIKHLTLELTGVKAINMRR
jgi:hypothetical protein